MFCSKLPLVTLLLLSFSNIIAGQQIINIDGREIILKEDGTWTYLSSDRFADTADGHRVRLKEDGSWQYVGNAPLITNEQVRTADLDLKLNKVVIERQEKKVQKNTRVRTQTVFHLDLEYSAQSKKNISISENDTSYIEVKDDNGKSYPVLSIDPGPAQLKPGSKTTIIVRAEKSPSVWNKTKSMQITFNPQIFGLHEPMTITRKVTDFEEIKVDGFKGR